jgi:asparagine synthase (glutamine-hydrolysing)
VCGITGILNFDASRAGDPAILSRMLQSIVHRGPDDEGTIVDGEAALGMRRLSIIDLQGGHQPIYDESGRFGVLFNGEIYNYRELQKELRARGHHLRTDSDTEVIVHLFEELGVDCVHKLRGMFAICVWDSLERRLWLVRDRLGIKPLYYACFDGCLIFGSEIKALLEYPGLPRTLDRIALAQYLGLKYVPAPRTLFVGISSLPPGHRLTCAGGPPRVERYWDLDFSRPSPVRTESEYQEALKELLTESVRLRLRSDVPFGAFLSGGVDSSTIVAVMSQLVSEPVKTFSVGFHGGAGPDELPYARTVARQFHAEHHEITVRSSDFRELAERVLWHLDQPIADQATIATYMVSQLASRHVKMVLTGEGGDELFAGYARYAGERYSPYTRWIPAPMRTLARKILPCLPGWRRPKIAAYALSHRDESDRISNWFPLFNADERQHLLKRAGVQTADGDPVRQAFVPQLDRCRSSDPISRMLYADTMLWLPDYLLLRGDKLTMAHSLEARVPLLDHKLVEFAATVPTTFKLRGSQRKYLLKQVAAHWLPHDIVHRRKQGFPIPLDRWLRHDCRDIVRDLLSASRLRDRDLFDVECVQTLMDRHESGYADHSTELWGLCSLEMWCQQFLDGKQTPVTREPALMLIPSEEPSGEPTSSATDGNDDDA